MKVSFISASQMNLSMFLLGFFLLPPLMMGCDLEVEAKGHLPTQTHIGSGQCFTTGREKQIGQTHSGISAMSVQRLSIRLFTTGKTDLAFLAIVVHKFCQKGFITNRQIGIFYSITKR